MYFPQYVNIPTYNSSIVYQYGENQPLDLRFALLSTRSAYYVLGTKSTLGINDDKLSSQYSQTASEHV